MMLRNPLSRCLGKPHILYAQPNSMATGKKEGRFTWRIRSFFFANTLVEMPFSREYFDTPDRSPPIMASTVAFALSSPIISPHGYLPGDVLFFSSVHSFYRSQQRGLFYDLMYVSVSADNAPSTPENAHSYRGISRGIYRSDVPSFPCVNPLPGKLHIYTVQPPKEVQSILPKLRYTNGAKKKRVWKQV